MKQLLKILTLLAMVCSNMNANIIINTSILNGSFETGAPTPWSVGSGGDRILVIEDDTFAYDGSWYAEIDIDRGRAFMGQNISIAPTVTDTFTLTFQARKDSPGPNSISAGMSSDKTNGAPLRATQIASTVPVLSETEWQAYTYTFQFSELWDLTEDVYVFIGFSEGWIDGSKGYIDAITLEKIPEPSTVWVILLGFFVIVLCRKNKKITEGSFSFLS